MRRYLGIYWALVKMNFATLVAYRGNFINSFMATMGWGVFSILSMLLLTTRVKSVYGWSRAELLILTGIYGTIVGLFHVFFSRNFERFSKIIDFGELDSLLLKPMNSQFAISLWLVGFTTLFRVIMAASFTVFIITTNHIHTTTASVISFMLLISMSLILFYSFWYIIATLMIWFPKLSNIVDLLFSINDISKYPPEMFRQFSNFFVFVVLPLTVVLATPLKVLVNKATYMDLVVFFIFTVGLFYVSKIFWKFALRHYTGASS